MLSLIIHRITQDTLENRQERLVASIFFVFMEIFAVIAVFSIAAMIGGIVGTQELAVTMGQIAGSTYLTAVIIGWGVVGLRHRIA